MNVGHTIRGTAWIVSQASVVKLYVETAYASMSGRFGYREIDFHLRPFSRVGNIALRICQV